MVRSGWPLARSRISLAKPGYAERERCRSLPGRKRFPRKAASNNTSDRIGSRGPVTIQSGPDGKSPAAVVWIRSEVFSEEVSRPGVDSDGCRRRRYPAHWSPCVPIFDFGFCILMFWHCGHCHLRFPWKIWPFSSFIATLHFLQVIADRFHFVHSHDRLPIWTEHLSARTLENANRIALRHTRISRRRGFPAFRRMRRDLACRRLRDGRCSGSARVLQASSGRVREYRRCRTPGSKFPGSRLELRGRHGLDDAHRRISGQLRPARGEGSPAAAAGFVHQRSLPHPESHARPGARPHSHESWRVRTQWLARRPDPAAIYCGRREDIRCAGNRTGTAREAASGRQSRKGLSFGEPHRCKQSAQERSQRDAAMKYSPAACSSIRDPDSLDIDLDSFAHGVRQVDVPSHHNFSPRRSILIFASARNSRKLIRPHRAFDYGDLDIPVPARQPHKRCPPLPTGRLRERQ